MDDTEALLSIGAFAQRVRGGTGQCDTTGGFGRGFGRRPA
jgi:hypothetical protein